MCPDFQGARLMRDFRGKEPPFGPHDDSEADAPPFELEMLEAALVVATGAPRSSSVHTRIVALMRHELTRPQPDHGADLLTRGILMEAGHYSLWVCRP